jgi:hypothetical protein
LKNLGLREVERWRRGEEERRGSEMRRIGRRGRRYPSVVYPNKMKNETTKRNNKQQQQQIVFKREQQIHSQIVCRRTWLAE